jgi:hypothetical protein
MPEMTTTIGEEITQDQFNAMLSDIENNRVAKGYGVINDAKANQMRIMKHGRTVSDIDPMPVKDSDKPYITYGTYEEFVRSADSHTIDRMSLSETEELHNNMSRQIRVIEVVNQFMERAGIPLIQITPEDTEVLNTARFVCEYIERTKLELFD